MSTFTLQILHFADGEAGLLASQTAPNLAALVDAFDDDFSNTLILSGGDNFIPSPFLNAGSDPALNRIIGATAIARPDIAIHNAIGVHASAIGNHEFDLGSNVFSDAVRPSGSWVGAQYAMLSSNIDFSGDSALRAIADVSLGGASSNLFDGNEAAAIKGKIAPSAVVTLNGEKVGLVGATTQLIEGISSPSGAEVKGFPFGPGANGERDDMDILAAQLQPVIDGLIAGGINKVILLSHLQQLSNERSLATKLKGVDIILAAGSNTRLGDITDTAVVFPGHSAMFADSYPIVTNGADGNTTLIVNTDNEFTYLGRLVLDFDNNGEIVLSSLIENLGVSGAYASTIDNVAAAWGVELGSVSDSAFASGTKGAQVAAITQAVQNVIGLKDGTIFGYTDVYLEGERSFVRSEETNLGNLTADANAFALRQALASTDSNEFIVSLKNGGGIRAQIGSISSQGGSSDKLPPPANPAANKSAGAISLLDIENSLRFDNKLMAFDTTPLGLKAILEHGLAVWPGQGRFPHVGGVSFSWDPDPVAGQRVSDAAVRDASGRSFALFNDGQLVAGAPSKITVVTLNFLANGGDGYPMKAVGENFRYLLDNNSLSLAVDEGLDFTAPSVISAHTPPGLALQGEQQATRVYLGAQHSTVSSAYSVQDTAIDQDLRIQNLNYRGDTVLAGVLSDAVGPTASLIHGLYITMYDRTADHLGLSYWLAQVGGAASEVSLQAAQRLGTEFKASSLSFFDGKYGVLSNRVFISELYDNLGGNTVGVSDGAISYWEARLDLLLGDRGALTGEFVKTFLGYNGNDPAGLARQAFFESKISVSERWADLSRHNSFMNAQQVDDPAFRAQQIVTAYISDGGVDFAFVQDQVGSVASMRSLEPALSIMGSSSIPSSDLLLA